MLNKILTSYVSNGQVKCFQVDENDVWNYINSENC
jgi:hypothetical protein